MKQIHVWPNHVAIPDADLVLWRAPAETLSTTLRSLARLGFDATPGNVELHGVVAGA
ncbi:MAG TPA: hypothetical protein VMG81_01895 [Thermoplasmata archaeon]|nr:hypothetical protein [Thermoplasmata archaeon]